MDSYGRGGGSVLGATTLPATTALAAVYDSYVNNSIAWGFLVLGIMSLAVSVSFIVRYFINKKI